MLLKDSSAERYYDGKNADCLNQNANYTNENLYRLYHPDKIISILNSLGMMTVV